MTDDPLERPRQLLCGYCLGTGMMGFHPSDPRSIPAIRGNPFHPPDPRSIPDIRGNPFHPSDPRSIPVIRRHPSHPRSIPVIRRNPFHPPNPRSILVYRPCTPLRRRSSATAARRKARLASNTSGFPAGGASRQGSRGPARGLRWVARARPRPFSAQASLILCEGHQ